MGGGFMGDFLTLTLEELFSDITGLDTTSVSDSILLSIIG